MIRRVGLLDLPQGLDRSAVTGVALGCGLRVALAHLQPSPDEEEFDRSFVEHRLTRGVEVLKVRLRFPGLGLEHPEQIEGRAAVLLGLIEDVAVQGIHFGVDAVTQVLELLEVPHRLSLGSNGRGQTMSRFRQGALCHCQPPPSVPARRLTRDRLPCSFPNRGRPWPLPSALRRLVPTGRSADNWFRTRPHQPRRQWLTRLPQTRPAADGGVPISQHDAATTAAGPGPVHRPGTFARPSPRRWPMRTADPGPCPRPSSRSSPGRRGVAG